MRWVDTAQGEPVIQLMSLTNHATSSSSVFKKLAVVYTFYTHCMLKYIYGNGTVEHENTYGFPLHYR